MFGLQRFAGCPEEIVGARQRWYQQVQPRFKLRGAYSDVCNRSNGGFQGCTFTVDDCNLLMAVWGNMQQHTCACMIRNFFDDSTTVCSEVQHVVDLLRIDAVFDKESGQALSTTKSCVVTNNSAAETVLEQITLGNATLEVKQAGKLVGAVLSFASGTEHFVVDARVLHAIKYLERVQFFPASIDEKSFAIGMQAAAKINVGLEVSTPSDSCNKLY